MHSTHVRIIPQHLISNILGYLLINVCDTWLLTGCEVIPLLLLFLLLCELLDLLLCLLTGYGTTCWAGAEICDLVVIVVIVLLLVLLVFSSLSLLLSLLDSLHLLIFPILLFFKFLYLLFQVTQYVLDLIIFCIVLHMIRLKET